ncbi:MAG: hypothetical protein Q7J67_05505 [bacterium]|nr:hypothetical protein [bacterium]
MKVRLSHIFKYLMFFILFTVIASTNVTRTERPLLYSMKWLHEAKAASIDNNAKVEVEVKTAKNEKIYTLNFKALEKTERDIINTDKNNMTGISEEVFNLHGKTVKITGYFLVPAEAYFLNTPVSSFAVSKNAYGCPCCSWGPLPTIFNTAIVTMKKGLKVNPPFPQLVEVRGTFMVKKEYYTAEDGKEYLTGLFFIKNAEAEEKKRRF